MPTMAPTDRYQPPTAWSPSCFVPLPEHRSAIVALRRLTRAVARGRRCPFVPLLLNGPAGCGKTHLTSDVVNFAAAHTVSVRESASDWIAPIQRDEIDRAGLLVVEDLQY